MTSISVWWFHNHDLLFSGGSKGAFGVQPPPPRLAINIFCVWCSVLKHEGHWSWVGQVSQPRLSRPSGPEISVNSRRIIFIWRGGGLAWLGSHVLMYSHPAPDSPPLPSVVLKSMVVKPRLNYLTCPVICRGRNKVILNGGGGGGGGLRPQESRPRWTGSQNRDSMGKVF